jgi:hypothetical protein
MTSSVGRAAPGYFEPQVVVVRLGPGFAFVVPRPRRHDRSVASLQMVLMLEGVEYQMKEHVN